jgi:hypothetical protein
MKTVIWILLTVLTLFGIALIWLGGLRLMLTGLFVIQFAFAVELHMHLSAQDEHRQSLAENLGDHIGVPLDKIAERLDALETAIQQLNG